jgi:hypothetical protein
VGTLYRGHAYAVEGRRLAGVNQGAYYGDDVQPYTNFPLVRLTNAATKHVRFLRTHDHSSLAIGPDHIASTQFEVPDATEPGLATLEVVANGVASPAISINVK